MFQSSVCVRTVEGMVAVRSDDIGRERMNEGRGPREVESEIKSVRRSKSSVRRLSYSSERVSSSSVMRPAQLYPSDRANE